IRARTAQINQIRALMGEFGWVSPQGPHQLLANLPAQLEQARETLPAVFVELIELLRGQLLGLNERIEAITKLIVQAISHDPVAQRLQTIP
ncbi:IS110 family transposase, partial [Salmonella enterica subsp. enterica]|nr:IS110 family transposase [Salmonella enterica]